MTHKVRKAVLPVAGLGTRFLPATKALPKEMLTVVDKPVVQYVVEEAVRAGITEIIFVTGRGKASIDNHFDRPYELVDTLEKRGKIQELDSVVNMLPENVRCIYTRQGQPLGLGHAIWCAKDIVGDEPFAVLLPDVIIDDDNNAFGQLVELFEETGKPAVMCEEVAMERTKNYGILDLGGSKLENKRGGVNGFVEKPGPQKAPSNLAITGRYVFTPRIFELLENEKPGYGGEIQLTDAMHRLAQEQGFQAQLLDGERFDCGDKVGWQMANLFFAMKNDYIAPRLIDYMENIVANYNLKRTA